MGFLSASVAEEGGQGDWSLRVESPSSTDDFRGHLHDGSSMALNMFTGDGVQLLGEAYVSSISDGIDSATIVALPGAGRSGTSDASRGRLRRRGQASAARSVREDLVADQLAHPQHVEDAIARRGRGCGPRAGCPGSSGRG